MMRVPLAPGYDISRVLKGGWQLAGGHGAVDADAALRDMDRYVEAGITTFDCADIYTGVEALIGRWQRGRPCGRHKAVHTNTCPISTACLIRADVARVTIGRCNARPRALDLGHAALVELRCSRAFDAALAQRAACGGKSVTSG
jgi:hypothetical protein